MKNIILALLLSLSMTTYADNQNFQRLGTVDGTSNTILKSVLNHGLCDAVNSGCYTGFVGNCFMSRGQVQYCVEK